MKRSFFVVFLLLIMGNLFAQNEYNLYKPTVIPPNPDIAALLKYLEAPVSPATGIISSTIPIYSINDGGISYNIGLSYNTSGIKVNEISSAVGLGWSINFPKIVRTVRGIADDTSGGFINQTNYTVENVRNISESMGGVYSPNSYDLEMKVVQRLIKRDALDLESDMYSLFLPNGENIQFMFNQNRSQENPKGEIVTFPKSYVKIIPKFTSDRITSWKVIDVDGAIYTFGGGNFVFKNESFTYDSDLPTLEEELFFNTFSSSWDLQKIESIDNKRIEFSYFENGENGNCNFVSQLRKTHPEQGESSITHSSTTEKITYLQTIEGDFGKVEFNWGSRGDYIGKKLQEIKIKDKTGVEVKSILFNYIYSQPNEGNIPQAMIYCDKVLEKGGQYNDILYQISKRMFLKTVTYKNGLQELNKYEFDYDLEPLPHRFSFAQDWWGFYNGENNNNNLAYDPYSEFWSVNKIKRHINAEKTQAGMLKKIIYPTGGYTEFEYENNRGLYTHKGLILPENNIIPSNVNTEKFNFDPDSNWNYNQNEQSFDYPLLEFETNNNVLNYFKKPDYNIYIKLFIEMEVNGICNSPEGDLPNAYECYSYYKIYDENNEIISGGSGYVVHGKKNIIEVPIGTTYEVFDSPKKYKLELKGYSGTGGHQREDFNPNIERVQFKMHWFVYNPDLVKKTGNFDYEIPIGGLRIKEVNHIDFNSNNPKSMTKRYIYKDGNGFESAKYNVSIDHIQMINHLPYVNSTNNFPLQTNGGNVLVYENFTEYQIDSNNPTVEHDSLSIVSNNIYHTGARNDGCHFLGDGFYESRSTPCFTHPLNGKTFQTDYGNKKKVEITHTANGNVPVIDYDLKKVSGIDYNVKLLFSDLGFWGDGFCSVNCISGYGMPDFLSLKQYFYYNISQFYDEQVTKIRTTNYLSDELIEETNSQFDSYYTFLPTETTTTNSLGETIKSEYQYPQDLLNKPYALDLTNANRISNPLIVKTYNNNNLISEQETIYGLFGNSILPKFVYAKKGAYPQEKKLTYDRYSPSGNLEQYTLENGTPVSIIWGYNGQYPIAKVEGLPYSSVQTEAAALLIVSNDGSLNPSSFESLRNKEGALVTSYIYKPLVGVTTIIQPNGQREMYEYDSAGRLKEIKDQDGNVLKKVDYHYQNQP